MAALPVPARRLALAALLAVVAVVAGVRHFDAHGQPAPLLVAPVRPKAVAPVAARRDLVVDVEGAVRRPGLVRLAQGSRVSDAVARAGGLTGKASRAGVNLAALVSDGEQVLVPAGGALASAAPAAAGSSGPVSLSSATAEQLDTLPGIGPVTAQKIVDYRTQHGPFRSVEGLDAIPGIGPARIAELQGLVTP